MVKKKFMIVVSILIIFFSCSKYEIIRVDNILEYQNYSEKIDMSLDSIHEINLVYDEYPLYANKFHSAGLIEIKGKTKELLSSKYNLMKDSFRKIHDGCDYSKFNPKEYAEHIYFCGRLELNENVESLLFLYEYDLGLHPFSYDILPTNELILFNFDIKENNLSSVVILSKELSKSEIIPSITQKANNYLFFYYYDVHTNLQQVVLYTSFYIDDCGYVRFQWFAKKKIPQLHYISSPHGYVQ